MFQNKFEKKILGHYFLVILFIILGLSLFYMNGTILKDALQIRVPEIERRDIFFQTVENFSYNMYMSRGHYLAVQENKGDLTCTEEVRIATCV